MKSLNAENAKLHLFHNAQNTRVTSAQLSENKLLESS